MENCPKGTPLNLCRNKELYISNKNEINEIIYKEKFCAACELIGPLPSEDCCHICGKPNDEKNLINDESLKQLDTNFDPAKYHSICFALATANMIEQVS